MADKSDESDSAADENDFVPATASRGTTKFERFTEQATRVMSLAVEEAVGLQHTYIGTEHVLLGLLREREGLAAKVLASLDVHLDQTRSRVGVIIGRGDQPTPSEVNLTPRTLKTIILAEDEARRLHHQHVGTEHLLLGLIAEGEGVAIAVLEEFGATSERVRAETFRLGGFHP